MALRPNNIVPGDDVHTVFRTINKVFVFHTWNDHRLFISALRRQVRRYGVLTYAWTGMSNHHHVFNQVPRKWHEETAFAREQRAAGKVIPVGSMVRDTQSYFALLFNGVNQRTGDLIQDRTKQIKVYGDYHALTLILYIFFNPVRAGMVNHPSEYPFSNYPLYENGFDDFRGLFTLHPAYLRLGCSAAERQERFKFLVDRAQRSWASRQWPGASGSQKAGNGSEGRAFDEFLELSVQWFSTIGFDFPTGSIHV